MAITWKSDWFYGNEISEYGKENGYVDYGTLAKAFDAVLNNNIISVTGWENWSQTSGTVDNSDEIDEITEKIEEIEDRISDLEDEINEDNEDEIEKEIDDLRSEITGLEDEISDLENEQEYPPEIFQYYIVSNNGAEILEEADEIVFYNEELDMYVWGVTHYGTAWDYVLTNIKIEKEDN